MSKIMVVARGFPPVVGGIENFMYNIYSRLSDDVIVIAPFVKDCNAFDVKQYYRIYRTPKFLKFLNKGKWPLLPLLLIALKTLVQYDIEQIHCDQVQSGIIGYLFKKLFRKPFMVYAYGMEIAGGGGHRLKSMVLQNADVVIAISNFTKRSLVERMKVGHSKIVIVYPGVDTVRFNPRVNYAPLISKYRLAGKNVILTVGRLSDKEQYKGHDMVIRSLPKIISKIPNIVYLIVGSGDDENRLKGIVHLLGLEDNVIFTGYVSDEQLPQYYCICNLFIMASREFIKNDGVKCEGFGIVFLEANACGKPVIGGRSGGIEDAVIDGTTGILVDSDNIDEIAETVLKLLSGDTLAQRLGRQGRDRVVNELSWDKVAAKVEEVVHNLR